MHIKNKFVLAFSVLALVLAVETRAQGYVNNVTITKIDVRSDGFFLVEVSSAIGGTRPGCANASDTNVRMTGDATTNGGKAVLQAAMSAYLAGKLIYIEGTNACIQYSGYESIWVWILRDEGDRA